VGGKALVTGGAGYIGSHVCVELLRRGWEVVVVDNLSNSTALAVERVASLSGMHVPFYEVDLRDKAALLRVFAEHDIDAVLHFAGLKAVGESFLRASEYYEANVGGTLVLLDVMRTQGCSKLVFSSSATVYGASNGGALEESCPLGPINPYGRSKLMIEQILLDLVSSDPEWGIATLRYFNPVGAHESGKIGESPMGIPNNLFPYVTKVAIGELESVSVFGNDYATPDGTGVRDYIHVLDLADGHVRALDYLQGQNGLVTLNLGTGRGYSVLDVIKTFEQVSGRQIPYDFTARRPGDLAVCFSDPSLAWKTLGWKAQYSLMRMCVDAWRWQQHNPRGYAEE